MRRLAIIAILAPFATFAQSLVDAEHLAAARAAFDAPRASSALKCWFSAVPPALNYGLRLETGFSVEIPMSQFQGRGHGWDVLLRVTPDGREPVFLTASEKLAEAPNWKDGEFKGTFLVGEGGYRIDAVLKDDARRVCKSSWRVQANLDGAERGFAPALAPGSVAELAAKPAGPNIARNASAGYVTALVHAASFVPGRAKIDEADVKAISGSLETLLERMRPRSMRVVIFDLERSAPLFERDDFEEGDVDAAAAALESEQLAVVDYSALKKSRGPLETAAQLVRAELARPDAPEALVFLGPYSPMPAGASASLTGRESLEAAKPFYLQYRQYKPHELPAPEIQPSKRRGSGLDVPLPKLNLGPPPPRADAIELVTKAMKGETIAIFRPHEFAGALRRILARLGAGAK